MNRSNRHGFEVTVHQLKSLEKAVRVLREDLKDAGPALQAAAPEAYEQRIAALQHEIAAYLSDHPADLSLLTRESDPPLAAANR